MRRATFALISITLAGLLLFWPQRQQQPDEQTVDPERELQIKQSVLNGDVSLTDRLCRSQCSLDFRRALERLRFSPNSDVQAELRTLQTERRHMDILLWSDHLTGNQQVVRAEGVAPELEQLSGDYMQEAKQTTLKGKTYQSPPILIGESTHFVLGVPSSDNRSSLVGVIHQGILHKVAAHQQKNLRLVPYPSDKRYKVESVKPGTLRDVEVDHPEDNEGTSHYHENEVVVKFRQTPNEAQLRQMCLEIRCGEMKKLGYTYVFRSGNMEAKQLMNYFQKWNAEYVEPHYLYMTNESFVPNDVLYSRYQWNLPLIETLQGWQLNRGSADVKVAVVDTGVDLNHPDLQHQLVDGYNFVDNNKPPADDVGHGTHVAGIISALVNNHEGVAGMTWYNPIIPVKALDHTGAGSTYTVSQAIIWAADHGAQVINLSLGNYAQAQFLHDAIKYAFDKDVLIIAASGNDNTEKPGYPAAYPEVFAVAATDPQKNKAPFSNFGDYIDVAAPGVNIASTFMNNQYAALSGTSMASPHVAALAALIRSANPMLKNTDVMEIMRQSAFDLGDKGKDKYFGYGQIDVVKALRQAGQGGQSLTLWFQWLARQLERIQREYAAHNEASAAVR